MYGPGRGKWKGFRKEWVHGRGRAQLPRTGHMTSMNPILEAEIREGGNDGAKPSQTSRYRIGYTDTTREAIRTDG